MHAQEGRMENMVDRVCGYCVTRMMLHGAHFEPVAIALIAATDYKLIRFLYIHYFLLP